jgi:hypothetical protein
MANTKTRRAAPLASELEAMHETYRQGGEEHGVAPHVVYPGPTCPYPGCDQPI